MKNMVYAVMLAVMGAGTVYAYEAAPEGSTPVLEAALNAYKGAMLVTHGAIALRYVHQYPTVEDVNKLLEQASTDLSSAIALFDEAHRLFSEMSPATIDAASQDDRDNLGKLTMSFDYTENNIDQDSFITHFGMAALSRTTNADSEKMYYEIGDSLQTARSKMDQLRNDVKRLLPGNMQNGRRVCMEPRPNAPRSAWIAYLNCVADGVPGIGR